MSIAVLKAWYSRLFALIIGINEYSDEKFNLRGAVRDADEFKNFLVSSLNVPEDRIVNLRDKEATRERIMTTMRDLAHNCDIRSQDPILIYYAGHGSQAKPPPDWSISTDWVQMLIPHDFKSKGSTDVRGQGQGIFDLDISKILSEVAENKSDNIVSHPAPVRIIF